MASNTTVNAKTVNSHSTNVNSLLHKNNVVTLAPSSTLTRTLSLDDSGSVFFLDSSTAAITFNLPAVGDMTGFNAKFIFSVASNNDVDFVSPSADVILSSVGFTVSGQAQDYVPGLNKVARVDASAVSTLVGDHVSVVCNGTNYIVQGFSNKQNNTALFVSASS